MSKSIKRILLAVSVIAAATAISLLSPRQLLAQVRAALVRDVDHPARQPVALLRGISFTGFGDGDRFFICTAPSICSLNVPLGKRLIIESMSVRVTVPSGQTVRQVSLQDPAQGLGDFYLAVNLQANEAVDDTYTGTHMVRMYIDPGGSVFISVGKSLGTGSASARATGYGYLVDLN